MAKKSLKRWRKRHTRYWAKIFLEFLPDNKKIYLKKLKAFIKGKENFTPTASEVSDALISILNSCSTARKAIKHHFS